MSESFQESLSEIWLESMLESLQESLSEIWLQSMLESLLESMSESLLESMSESLLESMLKSLLESVSESLPYSVSKCLTEYLCQNRLASQDRGAVWGKVLDTISAALMVKDNSVQNVTMESLEVHDRFKGCLIFIFIQILIEHSVSKQWRP